MNSYVNFYIRCKYTGAIISIADYNHSSMMYLHFSAILPYGKARVLDARDFIEVKLQIDNFIAHINKYIKSAHEYIATINNYIQSAHEHIVAIKPSDIAATYDIYSEDIASQLKLISKSKESIDELKRALIEVDFMQNMMSYKEVDVLAGIEVECDDETNNPIIVSESED